MSDRAGQVLAVYEAINRGDLAGTAGLVAPEFEWHPNAGEPDRAVRRDRREAMARARDFMATFGEFRTEVEEIRELGDQVAVAVRHMGTPAGASDQVERREAHLWTFHGELAVALHEYPTLDTAVAVAGTR